MIDGYLLSKVVLADKKRGGRKVLSDDELRARLRSVPEQKPAGFTGSVKDVLAQHSVLYDRLRKNRGLRRLAARVGMADPPPSERVEASFHTDAEYPWLPQAWEDHLDNLRQLKRAAETEGAAFFVVIFPTDKQVYEFLRPPGGGLEWEYPNKRLAEYFQREGIPFLDLLPEFRRYARLGWKPRLDAQEDLYWPYDGHLNIKGNRLAGLLIGRDVLERLFLDVHDQSTRLSNIQQLLSAETDGTLVD